MTRRASHRPQDDPCSEAEVQAAATSTAIPGLRRRLKRQDIEHPSVRRERGKLEEPLAALFEQAGLYRFKTVRRCCPSAQPNSSNGPTLPFTRRAQQQQRSDAAVPPPSPTAATVRRCCPHDSKVHNAVARRCAPDWHRPDFRAPRPSPAGMKRHITG